MATRSPSWDDLQRRHPDAPPDTDGYGVLARLEVPPLFDALLPALAEFDAQTLPHEAKVLRKQIGRVRDFLDLFVFAYDPDPKDPAALFDDDDPWRVIREDLDEGYELMGSFKDLYDLQRVPQPSQAHYEPDEVAGRRYKVLAWKTLFLAPPRLHAYGEYIRRPSLKRLYDRRKRHLPRFFWREADVEPKDELGGMANLARLQRALIKASRADLDAVADLDDLHEIERQEPFHDFRKRLRTVEKLAVYFPEIMEEGEGPTERLNTVIVVVDLYGDINDSLVAHARAEDRGRSKKAKRLEEEIAKAWKDLRKKQRQDDLDGLLARLRKDVHKP